jgi:anaerobic dimethyl sulfoxide reductase subunit C (anchor subunit)
MDRREWPLVAFTILGQTAVGAFWLTAVPLALGPARALVPEGPSPEFLAFGGIAGLLGVGAAASFLHLGRPGRAVQALRNLRESWLSREILGEVVFFVMLAGLALTEWIRPGGMSRSIALRGAVLAAGLSGLFFLYGMIRIYMIKTVPAWRDRHTPASFLVTALLLGALASAAFRIAAGPGRTGAGLPSVRALAGIALGAAAVGIVVSALWTPQAGMFGARIDTPCAPPARTLYPLLAVRELLLAGAGAAAWACREGLTPLIWPAVCGGVAAEVIGRRLFYSLYSRLGV